MSPSPQFDVCSEYPPPPYESAPPPLMRGILEPVYTIDSAPVRWSLVGHTVPSPYIGLLIHRLLAVLQEPSTGKAVVLISLSQYCLPSPVVLCHD